MRVIDHHPRCRVPKMEAFGERLGFRFVAHEIGDAAPEVALYVAALKQESRKVVALALRQLLRLLREHPREPFLAAVREANQYGLYDLDRLERMILRRVSRDYFLLPDTEPDSND